MRAPRFSVVLPTFDRRDLVLEAIASVEAQRFRDYELIVVDDGSTDGTRDAVAGRPGLIYVWQENRGEAVARNEGVARAHGELVAFLDSDCLWRPNHLEVM